MDEYRQDQAILVVDDDVEMRELIACYLGRAGLTVRQAGDGGAMWGVLRAEPVALVVLDVMLPGRDGFELCRELRQHQPGQSLPVIMVTARDELSDRVVGLELGADDYLAKPFEPRELLARIKAVLRRCRVRSSDATYGGGLATVDAAAPLPSVMAFGPDGLWRLDLRSRELHTADRPAISLPSSDFKVLRSLLLQPDYPVSRDRLLEQAFGRKRSATDRAIDVCVSRLRSHLEADARHPRLIRTVRHEGYMYCSRPLPGATDGPGHGA